MLFVLFVCVCIYVCMYCRHALWRIVGIVAGSLLSQCVRLSSNAQLQTVSVCNACFCNCFSVLPVAQLSQGSRLLFPMSDSEDSSEGDSMVIREFFLPWCRCPSPQLSIALWVPGERYARCFECCNRLVAGHLCVERRMIYLVMLLLRHW